MAPDLGPRAYTVSCALAKAVLDPEHLAAIRDAVARVHACTYHATDLLNLYIRDRLENHNGTGLEGVFTANWLLNACNAVSAAATKRVGKVDAGVQTVFDAHMRGTLTPPARAGLTQALVYECINLAAVGSTNVWMHFRKRVLAYARTAHALDEDAYKLALSKDARRARGAPARDHAGGRRRLPHPDGGAAQPAAVPRVGRCCAREPRPRRRGWRRLGRQAAAVPPQGQAAPLPQGHARDEHGAARGWACGGRTLPAAPLARAAARAF